MIQYDPHRWSDHLFDVKGSLIPEITLRVLSCVVWAVAVVVVYQVLSNDIRRHLPEYATLNAMGYTNRYLSRVVVVPRMPVCENVP